MDDVLGPTLANSHRHRIQHQFGAQVVCHRPADDLAAPGVEHDGEIEKPRHGRHISDVGDPQLVRSGSVEVAVDQVGRGPVILVPPGCCRAPVPMTGANQAAAFERISRSSRSCLFSRRSRVNSSRSNAVRPGAAASRRPSCRSVWATRANGVAAWLKLAGKIVRITSSTDEVDHLSAKLRRIRWTCSWHRQHLWRETQGVHQTGSIPIPSRHWFRLGRAVAPIERGAALISWSGSMFEYLMPSLVMRAPAGSLIEQTNRLIVRRQMSYGAALGLPWGISESAYNARDLEFTYQYSNFGVPGLGLKRGLSENAVVAPYATALAAMVEPAASVRNFGRLAAVGASGRYGFYEALDYTRSRLPEGKDCAVVRAFMAHHQGMTVVAIANALLDAEIRARFHAEPIVQATELLLQERTPRDVAAARPRAEEVEAGAAVRDLELPTVRRLRSAHAATPEAHLLSNSRYAVMLTGAGSGYSRWRDLGITRWCEDATGDDGGAYGFLRDG